MGRVSVCIPVYNGAQYVERAVESVLRQAMGDWELVICDNASTDGTADRCRRFRDPRVRYLFSPEHTGQAGNFNRCLAAATGEFITMLHADDCLLPGFFETRLGVLGRMPELAYAFGAVQIIDERGQVLEVRSRWKDDRQLASHDVVEALLFGSVVCGPTVMFRAQAGKRAGAYRTDLSWGHDWDWMIRLAEQGDAYHFGAAHAAYRQHEASGTAAELNAGRNGPQERRILGELFGRISDPRLRRRRRDAFAALALRHLYFAERALELRLRAVATRNVMDALLADPRMAAKPTVWALLAGAVVGPALYRRYRSLRGSLQE